MVRNHMVGWWLMVRNPMVAVWANPGPWHNHTWLYRSRVAHQYFAPLFLQSPMIFPFWFCDYLDVLFSASWTRKQEQTFIQIGRPAGLANHDRKWFGFWINSVWNINCLIHCWNWFLTSLRTWWKWLYYFQWLKSHQEGADPCWDVIW